MKNKSARIDNDISSFLNNAKADKNEVIGLEEIKQSQQELLRVLIVNDESNSCVSAVSDFLTHYERFLYSDITDFVFTLDDSEMSVLLTNIEKVLYNNDLPQHYKQSALKLYDHCNLAILQSSTYKQSEKQIKAFVDNNSDEKMRAFEKDMTAHLLGLVSIFTALSFLFTGGMDFLGYTLESTKQMSIFQVAFVISLCGIIFVSAFAFFVYLILKITKKSAEINIFRYYISALIALMFILVISVVLYIKFRKF